MSGLTASCCAERAPVSHRNNYVNRTVRFDLVLIVDRCYVKRNQTELYCLNSYHEDREQAHDPFRDQARRGAVGRRASARQRE
jgi:hypothetical protein